MKIVLLSGASSIHTIRWANGLCDAGHEVHVITQQAPVEPFDEGVIVHQFPNRGALGYFIMVPAVRKLLRKIKPNIVNAHYASGYATTARLVGYHPWLLSVWGSDVYTFPYKSRIHKMLVQNNIRAADCIASTSHCMAEEIRSLVPVVKNVAITPFGVDLSSYSKISPVAAENKAKLVIGTVKSMRDIYGIDILIQAYALLIKHLNNQPELSVPDLELRLVGGGDQFNELQSLAKRLQIVNSVKFVGRVPHSMVPQELEKLDIYVALSRTESFGVAIIEAGAAGRPVVVSNVGGLPEVTIDGVTGFVVPQENPAAAAEALMKLVLDAELRHRMGMAGREHVAKCYSWGACVQNMLSVYAQMISSS